MKLVFIFFVFASFLLTTVVSSSYDNSSQVTKHTPVFHLYKVKAKNSEDVKLLHSVIFDSRAPQFLLPVREGKSSLVLLHPSDGPNFQKVLNSSGIRYKSKGITLISRLQQAEDLVPIEPIHGTHRPIYTGVPYRLGFRDLGNAPVTYRDSNNRDYDLMIAERRQSEWSHYAPGGSRYLDGIWMFIPPTNNENQILNLGILRRNSNTCLIPTSSTFGGCPTHRCAYLTGIANFCFGVWWPEERPGGVFRIHNSPSTVLAYEPANEFSAVSMRQIGEVPESRTHLTMSLAGAGVSGHIISFEFVQDPSDLENHIREVTLVHTGDIINNSSQVITRTITAAREITDTFTFGFSQSLNIMSRVSVQAGIPLLGNARAEGGIDLNFGFHQEITSTTTHTFTINEEIPVAPRSRVSAHGIIKIADSVTMPFRAQMEVTLNINRLTTFGRQVVYRPVPAALLEEYLMSNKVEGTIIARRGNTVVLEVEGTVYGTWGIITVLHVNESPL